MPRQPSKYLPAAGGSTITLGVWGLRPEAEYGEARQAWQFPPGAGARSVIIHEEHTGVTPPDADPAGARLGCLDVVF